MKKERALEIVRKRYAPDGVDDTLRIALETLIPELAESEDEHRRKDAIYFLESAKKHYADTSEIEKTIAWLKSLCPQPKKEWGEDDEKVIEAACALLCEYAGYYKEKDMEAKNLQLFKVSQRLKSLRPSWKPSEEQMKGLLVAIGDEKERGSDVVKPLRSLYPQLQKLI